MEVRRPPAGAVVASLLAGILAAVPAVAEVGGPARHRRRSPYSDSTPSRQESVTQFVFSGNVCCMRLHSHQVFLPSVLCEPKRPTASVHNSSTV